MIRYYRELENPYGFMLPLIKRDKEKTKYVALKRKDLPLNFFDNYEYLIKTIKYIDNLIRTLDLGKIAERIDEKVPYDKYGNFDYKSYSNDYQMLIELENICEMPEKDELLKTSSGIVSVLEFYKSALSVLIYLYPETKDKWHDIVELFPKALNEFEIYNNIKYEDSSGIADAVILPNSWYITAFGDLYNSRYGHKEATLVHPYNNIKESILSGTPIKSISNLLNKRQEIIRNGFINYIDFSEYLNYEANPPHILKSSEGIPITYEPRIVKAVLGVISAQICFYSFFKNLQMNTNNPKKEFKRLNEMTKNNPDDRDFRDIFVRCAGFYKIETTLEKTITTSSFTPFEDLPEYLKRGWDVCIIPPIIVNSEKGIISELDMNSLLVERYLERYLEKYDKVKESGYGRIYRKLPHQKPVRQNF
jgi:hypothetical protein